MSTTLQRTLLKVIVLGDVGVGKTSLITRYVHQTFNEQYKATIGADFFTKELHTDGKVVSLQIWDTAGQERFNSLGPAFYRGADCCVLVFDVNVLKSFDSLLNWHEDFINQTNLSEDPNKFPFVVIGNKIDVNDGASRTVAEKRAKEWCTTIKLGATGSNSVPYFETSAKEGSNVENAFLGIAKSALSHERGQDIYFESITGSLPEIVEQQSGGCSC